MIRPYYQEKGISLYLGDSRQVLPHLPRVQSIITDPVWPNVPEKLRTEWEVEDPYQLMADTAKYFPSLADTAVIIQGSDSDPRFLTAIPSSMPFIRTQFTEYRMPSFKGNLLLGNDTVYSFGAIPKDKPGKLMPGKYMEKERDKKTRIHPCPRNLQLTKWLVKWWAPSGPVLDPFSGSGTTLLAAAIMRVPAIGIEKNKNYADASIHRLEVELQALLY